MTHKMRKTLIMIVMAALIICLMAASLTYTFTYGLYTGGKFDSDNSPYDDIIEFVGAREYTVRSPEELIQAIEDGYSNIVIAEDAEQPFVITEGVTDVTANLVLNLNGNVVVRNSRNPMLDVQTNVSVVLVYDSTNNGAFYNPVGSSLMASGGSLTVGSGGYESGPRAEEYQGKAAAGTLGSDTNVTLFARSNETNNETNAVTSPTNLDRSQYISGYSPVSGVSLPTITPKTTQENNRETVRGNVYLSSNHSDWLPADTFLVYTEAHNCFIGDGTTSGDVTFKEGKLYFDADREGGGSDTQITATEFKTPLCDVASCDFYYYYPIGDDDNDGYEDYAVIYGYWDVMKLASNKDGAAEELRGNGLVYPYGAVRMVEGEGIVRGGTFSNHFDAVNTYGIYAEGGTLSVSKNTTVETTFTTGGEGVCIRSSGESAELTISGGDFSSEVGNTIEMLNGNMTVTKGSFTKTGCKKDTGDAQLENQTAIISLMGGTLNVSGAQSGDVTMTAGAENSTLENVFGIRAAGGGTVTTKGVNFNIYGDYSAGVLSYDGTIDLGNDTVINVTQSDEKKDANNNTLLTSAGVSSEQTLSGVSENEEHPVNLSGGVTITSNGLGITARGVVNVEGGTSTVTTERGTGIYVNNGQFNVEKGATINVNSTVKSGYSWTTPPNSQTTNTPNIYNGVYVQGGSLVSNGTLNVTFTGVESDNTTGAQAYLNHQIRSHAVRVEQGTGTDTIVAIASGTILNGTRDTNDTVIAESGIGGGVLVNGGTVYLGATVSLDNSGNIVAIAVNNPVSVTTTGTANHGWNGVDFSTANGEQRNNWDYRVTQTGGDAVKVVNGQLTVYGGSYTSSQGNGIAIQQTTGTATATVYGGTFSGDDVYSDNTQNNSFYTGPGASYAFKVLGGDLTIYDGRFISEDGGAFVMNGTATMYGGIIAAQGATAFVTYNGAEVTFDPVSELNVQGVPSTDRTLYVSGASTGLTVESVSGADQNISINGGVFTGGTYSFTAEDQAYSVQGSGSSRNGIWYGNGGATLEITDGTFQGENVSGLYFQVVPSGSNVQLSGGTYSGSGGAINAYSPGSINTNQIFKTESGGNSWVNDGNNDPIYYKHDWHLISGLNFGYYHDHVGGDQDLSLSSDLDTSSPVRVQALTDYDTIIVTTTQAPSYEE